MRTFPLRQVPPASPGFDLTLTIPNVETQEEAESPPPAAACACSDLAALWYFGSAEDLATSTDTDPPPTFAISGTICPGTVFTATALSWVGFGAAPDISPFGDGVSAWAVWSIHDGTLTIQVTADCNGVTSTLNTLTVTFGTSECPGLPDDWTNIITLVGLCPGMTISPVGSNAEEFYSWDDDVFTIHRDSDFPQIPHYEGTSEPTGVWLQIDNIGDLANGASMDVRFTLVENSMNDDSHGQYVDTETGALADFPDGTVIERTLADASTFYTGAGVGDGAGGTGTCVFRVEVRKTPS